MPVYSKDECPIEYTLNILGSKWALLIVRDLFTGTKRFGELRRSLRSCSPKTLVERLRELEAENIIARTVYPEVPPRVEYYLTERGESLRPILQAMMDWGRVGDPGKAPNTEPVPAPE
jgi:DNA-binding HxlR family transcriptional regulator